MAKSKQIARRPPLSPAALEHALRLEPAYVAGDVREACTELRAAVSPGEHRLVVAFWGARGRFAAPAADAASEPVTMGSDDAAATQDVRERRVKMESDVARIMAAKNLSNVAALEYILSGQEEQEKEMRQMSGQDKVDKMFAATLAQGPPAWFEGAVDKIEAKRAQGEAGEVGAEAVAAAA